jgi:hypothetical protein
LRASVNPDEPFPENFLWKLTPAHEEATLGLISTDEYYKAVEDLGFSGPDRQPDEPGPTGSDNVSPAAEEPQPLRMAMAVGVGGQLKRTIQPAKDLKPKGNNPGRS